MAVQLTLTDISSGYQGSDIQANFTAIEDEFDKVLYRDGSLTVTDTIDMNSQRLVNLPAPTSSTEPLRKDDQFTSTEAQAFATDAETAQTAAEAALTMFQSKWLGPSATDPTTDGNGDALTEGDLYFDTTNDVLKAYDGSSWINPALLYFPNVDANVTATEDELNLLDGATVTTAEINILDGVTATTAELNTLDGVTSSAAELNILDGVTATSAELNNADADTAGGGFLKGPTSSTDPFLAFGTWRTPNANRATMVEVEINVVTDGVSQGLVKLFVDESGGTTSDYDMILAVADYQPGDGFDVTNVSSFFIPPGGSYMIANVTDPKGFNNINDHREFTL